VTYNEASVRPDTSSRKDWEDTYRKGLDLLGFKYEKEQNLFKEQVVQLTLFLLKRLHNFKRKLTKNYYQQMVQLELK